MWAHKVVDVVKSMEATILALGGKTPSTILVGVLVASDRACEKDDHAKEGKHPAGIATLIVVTRMIYFIQCYWKLVFVVDLMEL